MSAVVKFVESVVNTVVNVVVSIVNVVVDLLETLWKDVLVPILEFIAGLFGIQDQDIIQTKVNTMRIIQDNVVASNLITKVKLEEQKNAVGVIDRLMAYTDVVRKRYSKYFTYGDTTFIDKLPDANLRALYVDNVTIKQVIDGAYGVNATIISSTIGNVNKTEFVGFSLQETYGYTPYNNILPYNGYNYLVDSIDYNYTTNIYDVYISAHEDQTTHTETTTVVTIVDNGNGTSNKNITITDNVTITGVQQGFISNVVTEVSNINTVITTGTETNSSNTVISDVVTLDVTFATATLIEATFLPVRYYIVKYYTTDVTKWSYWVYKAHSGGYPVLDNTNTYAGQLDMLPVVTIRNSTININADKTSTRYKQSQQMCKYLGLNIDDITDGIMQNPSIAQVEDCFVHFGLIPSDTSSMVSKALFLTFDFIYNDSGLLQSNDKYTATISEGSFNAAIAWTAQSRVVTTGILGSKGYYTHSISGKNLIIQWQATEEQYVTITLTNLSSITFIDRQGLHGTVGKDVDQAGFFVPVSYYFIQKLSPLEQYELFNHTLLLSLYAAEVIHLEWYQTSAFMNLLSIIGVLLSIITLGTSLLAVQAGTMLLSTLLMGIAVSVGATMLLKVVMESTNSDVLRGVAAALYVVAMAYGAGGGFTGGFDASTLTKMVTVFATSVTSIGTSISMYASVEIAKIEEKQSIFTKKVSSAQGKIDKAAEALNTYMDIYDVLDVMATPKNSAYIEGVDAMIYRAIGAQYDFAKPYDYGRMVGDFYGNKFKLGIV